jgi:hypothetical protein
MIARSQPLNRRIPGTDPDLWVPKTRATWPDALLAAGHSARVRHMRVRSWPAGARDVLRLAGLKLIFLIVTVRAENPVHGSDQQSCSPSVRP